MADDSDGTGGIGDRAGVPRVRRDIAQWLEIARAQAYHKGFAAVLDEARDWPEDALWPMLGRLLERQSQLARALRCDLLDNMAGKTRVLVLLHCEDGAGRVDAATDILMARHAAGSKDSAM